MKPAAIPVREIADHIRLIRQQRVILDSDLAALYGVVTKALNQAVKRNADRFPADFLLRLTPQETQALNRSQIVTGSQKHRDCPQYSSRPENREWTPIDAKTE